MALKQTRRTVSFNRTVFEAVKAEADRRGMTASHFVESLVRRAIKGLPKTAHVTPVAARRAKQGKTATDALARRIAEVLAKHPQLLTSKKRVRVPKRKPIEAKRTGGDAIDSIIADTGPQSFDGQTLAEKEFRKRKRSLKVAKKLRASGILKPENEGYARGENWNRP